MKIKALALQASEEIKKTKQAITDISAVPEVNIESRTKRLRESALAKARDVQSESRKVCRAIEFKEATPTKTNE